jgi:5-methylcytosine-specific restriction protein A
MGLKERWTRPSRAVNRTARWRALRWQILERDGFRCVQCQAVGRLEVDHIEPVRDAPEKAFDPANLQTLCPRCHTRKTRIECGHPPASEARQRWAELVRMTRRNTQEQEAQKCCNP